MITLIIILVMLAIVLGIGIAVFQNKSNDNEESDILDKEYKNEEGDHVYYDRSLIEKKEYKRQNPNAEQPRNLANFFRNKS